MSAAYVRRYYGVPAKRGGRIRYTFAAPPTEGTIVGFSGQYLRVRLDGGAPGRSGIFTLHPTWNVEYLGGAQ